MDLNGKRLAIIRVGCVGLNLAVEFGKRRPATGFDVNLKRAAELRPSEYHTLECSRSEFKAANHLRYSADPAELEKAQVFIVSIPTPVDQANHPDMRLLVGASEKVGNAPKRGDVVVYEATVFPGATEEVSVPALERVSGLKFNVDFYCGYSPELVEFGDTDHRVPNLRKATSGSTQEVAYTINEMYAEIVTANTYKASRIKMAEVATVIANTQQDVNIAFENELSLVFNPLGIDTVGMKQAAGPASLASAQRTP